MTSTRVRTSDLRVGDVIRHPAGMLLRVETELTQYINGGAPTVYAATARVLNPAESEAVGVPASWMRDEGQELTPAGPGWRVQGNDLATWNVIERGAKTFGTVATVLQADPETAGALLDALKAAADAGETVTITTGGHTYYAQPIVGDTRDPRYAVDYRRQP